MNFETSPNGIEGNLEHDKNSNMYRDHDCGQPKTLAPGDVVANGLKITSAPTDEHGGIGLHFDDGSTRTVPASVPLLLQGGAHGRYPLDLKIGEILATGSVVLEPVQEIHRESSDFVPGCQEVFVTVDSPESNLTMGLPKDLVLALQ